MKKALFFIFVLGGAVGFASGYLYFQKTPGSATSKIDYPKTAAISPGLTTSSSTASTLYSSLNLPTSTVFGLVPNKAGSLNNPDINIGELVLLNQLFNKNEKFPLGSKGNLSFSDLVVLGSLFHGQTDQLITPWSFGSNNRINLQDLMILNQLFNGGKPIENPVSVNPQFGNLLLLYFLFK